MKIFSHLIFECLGLGLLLSFVLVGCAKPPLLMQELKVATKLLNYEAEYGSQIALVEIPGSVFEEIDEKYVFESALISEDGTFEMTLDEDSVLRVQERQMCEDGKMFPVPYAVVSSYLISASDDFSHDNLSVLGTFSSRKDSGDPVNLSLIFVGRAVTVRESCQLDVGIGLAEAVYDLQLEAGWNLTQTRLSSTIRIDGDTIEQEGIFYEVKNYSLEFPDEVGGLVIGLN